MKFSPGDPVWARQEKNMPTLPAGEHAGTVIARPLNWYSRYEVDLLYHKPKFSWFGFLESELRPRRDDYQQHEGLGSMDKITEPLRDDPIKQREPV